MNFVRTESTSMTARPVSVIPVGLLDHVNGPVASVRDASCRRCCLGCCRCHCSFAGLLLALVALEIVFSGIVLAPQAVCWRSRGLDISQRDNHDSLE